MKARSRILYSFVAAGLIVAATLSASPVGSVSGTVKDSSGSIVTGVRLTLTSTATNAQFATTTNPQGEFQFLQLAPSTYSLAAESPGFKKSNVPSVLVQVDQVTHIELTLEVGTLTESIDGLRQSFASARSSDPAPAARKSARARFQAVRSAHRKRGKSQG